MMVCSAAVYEVSRRTVLFMNEITRILFAVEQGDPQAAHQLLPLVYDELRKLAAARLAQEKPGQTLEATALVHEAYVRIVVSGDASAPREQQWNSRGHFFAAAAEAMRRILIENARRKQAEKHGGHLQRIDLANVEVCSPSDPEKLLLLDDALDRLAELDPAAAAVAKLRLFAGLAVEEASLALGVSRATAFRHWTYARAWLQARLGESDTSQKT